MNFLKKFTNLCKTILKYFNHILSVFLHMRKTKEVGVGPLNTFTPLNIH
jgi:hypothetical protein